MTGKQQRLFKEERKDRPKKKEAQEYKSELVNVTWTCGKCGKVIPDKEFRALPKFENGMGICPGCGGPSGFYIEGELSQKPLQEWIQ